MNHYEELGVPRSASLADIRLAYKTLVRVLHPDQQQDEHLRRLSELQLRRLNHILETLSDPEQRRRYDRSLDREALAPRFPEVQPIPRKAPVPAARTVRRRVQWNAGALVWLLIGAIALGSAVVWMRSPDLASSRPGGTPQSSGPSETAKPAKEIAAVSEPGGKPTAPRVQGPAAAGAPLSSRDGGLPETKPSPLGQPPVQKEPVPETVPEAIRPEPAKNPQLAATAPVAPVESVKPEEPPPVPAKAPTSWIAGKWLYVPKPDDHKNLYPAEYIELRISSRGGLLKGKYRGKYRVTDRAISSEINFQFEGRQGESVSLVPWYSSNGSKGELRLKRLSDETIEVNWITTSFGTSNTLASGTAVLYKSDSP